MQENISFFLFQGKMHASIFLTLCVAHLEILVYGFLKFIDMNARAYSGCPVIRGNRFRL